MPAFIGEIQAFGGQYAPKGWARCEGQILQISQNAALFNLLGTTYGGDGRSTFGLPDLRGRVPIGVSDELPLGSRVGVEQLQLTAPELPAHSHRMRGTGAPPAGAPPVGLTPAAGGAYATTTDKTRMGPAIGDTGGSQPHPNLAPSIVLLWCIAIQGEYPA